MAQPGKSQASPEPAGPLAGYRILELAANFTAPVATMMLGDQGADVIKIENGTGDQMRYASTYRNGTQGLASIFLGSNRNKRSIVLDLKTPAAMDAITRLIQMSDVFVQNHRPGVAERLGLGYEAVRAVRDEIIYVSVDGVGPVGPDCKRKYYDTVIQGISGVAAVQRDIDTKEPRPVQTAIADKVTALFVFQAITAALLARERTGQGQHVRVSMLDATISFLWPDSMVNCTLVGDDLTRLGSLMDARLVYRTKDDFLLAASMSNADWAALTSAVGRQTLVNDPRFATITDRVRNVTALHDALEDAFLARTTAEWVEILREADAVFAPVNRPENVHRDPQVVAAETIIELEHPIAGPYRQPVHPIKFEGTPAGFQRHAPALGEHTDEVLSELGLTPMATA